jgi:hypothetical protein
MKQNFKVHITSRPNFTAKNVDEALKNVAIEPKSFFSKYAINAIAKTTPCLKKW